MDKREIKQMARYQAGLALQGAMNMWEPDRLVEQYGQDTVDEVAVEILAIAHRLIGTLERHL